MIGLPLEIGTEFAHKPISYSEYLRMCELPAYERVRTPSFRAINLNDGDKSTVYFTYGSAAIKQPENVTVPEDVRGDAERYSRDLVFNLSAVVSRVERHKAHGSLDSSKLSRLARPGISTPEFERLAATAFKSRGVRVSHRKPRLAIVADMNWTLRKADPEYGPRVSRLAYIMSEACKLAGMESALYLSRGTLEIDNRYAPHAGTDKPLHIPAIAKDWHDDVTGPRYWLFNDNAAFVGAIRTCVTETQKYGYGIGSKNGSGGIEFARMQGADFVIGLGEFSDATRPDCHLSTGNTLDQMVSAAVEAFQTFQARAAA